MKALLANHCAERSDFEADTHNRRIEMQERQAAEAQALWAREHAGK